MITNIGHDHLASLGPTLEDVARQKGGIIKEGVPVFCGRMPEALMAVLDEMAHQKKTVIHYSDPPEVTQYPIDFHYRGLDIRLGDVGMYQVANASLAIDVVLGLWSHALDAAIISGLRMAHWPGRFEHFTYQGQDLFLDGAHNREAMTALIQTVKQRSVSVPLRSSMRLCAIKIMFGWPKCFRRQVLRFGSVISMMSVPYVLQIYPD